MLKPGIKTSELVAKVLVDVAATVLLVKGDVTPDAWATMVGTTTSVYVAARTLLKLLVPSVAPAPVPTLAPASIPAPVAPPVAPVAPSA